MGLSSGALTFFRLRFDEQIKISVTELYEALNEWSFETIMNEDNLINYGFVPFAYPENFSFESSDVLFDNQYVFGLRFDETRINKKYFDIALAGKKRAFLVEAKKDRLSKSDIEFLKNALTLSMAKKTLPMTNLIEIIFKPEVGTILLSGLSTKVFDAMEHLFKAAFDIVIYKDSLFESAKRVCADPMIIDDLTKASPSDF